MTNSTPETYEKQQSVAFTGHRAIKEEHRALVTKKLKSYIAKLAERGYRVFYSGMAPGFDTEAAREVLLMKQEHPEVRLVCVLPGKGQDDKWSLEEKQTYRSLLKQADAVIYPMGEDAGVSRETYFARDDYMVDHSDVLVYYYYNYRSGTGHTLRYAQKRGLKMAPVLDDNK